MTKPGKMIRVARSVVTGIRVADAPARLEIEGVDQDKDGNTLKHHQLSLSGPTVPDAVAEAAETIVLFAQRALDEA
jgi:hypothetical protein